MFSNQDRNLYLSKIAFLILSAIMAVTSLVVGILNIVLFDAYTGTIIILYGLVGAFLFWILTRLLLELMCDVKLIRNALYKTEDKNLYRFINEDLQMRNPPEATQADDGDSDGNGQRVQDASLALSQSVENERFIADAVNLLGELRSKYDSGEISQEQYEAEKRKITERI